MFFGSDNAAPAHPAVLDAIAKANQGYAPSYGADTVMDEVRDRIRAAFEAPEAAVYLVSTGTTANVLSLAVYTQPWQTIFCHRDAHVAVDECGAPEFYAGGAKLTLLDGPDGKFTAETLASAIGKTAQGFVHSVQRGPVSLTNVTECGTVYTPAEVAAISAAAHENGMAVHMDGARFANALVSTNASPADMTWRAGVDVLSFGGTKNGLMGVEAVILLDPAKAWEFELRRKRGGHLFSKHRYLSAQMQAYLTDGLWLDMARDANAMAARLEQGIIAAGGAMMYPRQANILFAHLPRAIWQRAADAGAVFHLWPFDQSMTGPDDEILSARLVTSWCTTEGEIDSFLKVIAG